MAFNELVRTGRVKAPIVIGRDRLDSGSVAWASVHHGSGVGIGYSIHAGQVSVADGSELAGAVARARIHH